MSAWHDLGGVQVRGIITSRFRLDGGSMFGQVPKPLWSRFAKADEENRIPLVVRSLLVRTSAGVLLVDPGMGLAYPPEELQRLALDSSLGSIQDVLRGEGIDPDSVSHVLLTHLHFDHVGGLGGHDGSGVLQSLLPRARIHLHRTQWERAQRPGPKERRSYRNSDMELLSRLDTVFLDEETEILPGVTARPTEGHTTGLLVVAVKGTKEHLQYPSDLIPTLAHIRSAYTTGFDLKPECLIVEKDEILAAAAGEDGVLMFNHDPLTAACRIKEGKRGFVVHSKVQI